MADDPDDVFSRAHHHALAFRRGLDDSPQRPTADYRVMLDRFAQTLPDAGQPGPAVIDDLMARIRPGLAAMVGRRFFGWVMGASHPVGVAADWMVSAFGQNAGNHVASPASAAAEAVTAGWLLELLSLPREASIGFVTGATVANFVCLAAARNAVLRTADWDVEADGLFGAPPITVLIGADAHATVFSALQFLGLGSNRVLRLPTDAQGRIRPAEFAERAKAISGPSIVILQAGQINTGAFDPFAELIPAAKAAGAWVHVDGAFGLWARAAPNYAALTQGIEGADSWATDGHKWLQTPYDLGFAIVRDAEAHRRAMTIAASYLPAVAESERDPSHYVPELSRRARGLPAYAMIRHLGRGGIADMVERHCRLAARLADRLRQVEGIAIANDVVLNQIAVRFGAGLADEAADELTRRTIAALQAGGVAFAGGAQWRGRWIMRLSVISFPTTEADIDRAADAIIAAWRPIRDAN